jgi:hypothetical protein
MKPFSSTLPLKRFFIAITLLAGVGVAATSRADAQTVTAVGLCSMNSSVPAAAGYSTAEFAAYAFPVLAPLQVRVIFENQTAYPVCVSVRSIRGEILYSKSYMHTPKYNGLLDFSQFPDGEYWVEVRASTSRMGKTKHLYEQTFQVRSQTARSLAPSGKNLKKELYTRRTLLSRK